MSLRAVWCLLGGWWLADKVLLSAKGQGLWISVTPWSHSWAGWQQGPGLFLLMFRLCTIFSVFLACSMFQTEAVNQSGIPQPSISCTLPNVNHDASLFALHRCEHERCLPVIAFLQCTTGAISSVFTVFPHLNYKHFPFDYHAVNLWAQSQSA